MVAKQVFVPLMLAGLLSATASAVARAQNPLAASEEAKLIASGPPAEDQFGYSTAVSGDTAVIGAPWDDSAGANAGAAYVFVRSGAAWNLQQKLIASDGAAADEFGRSVAVSGDTVLIGMFSTTSLSPGRAYVFTRSGTTWSEQQKLMSSNSSSGFGFEVALDGDMALISDSAPTGNGSQGYAFVFARNGTTWSEEAQLAASGTLNKTFGFDVAFDGDTAVIGAPEGTQVGGSAYVFTRSGTTWSLQQKLDPSDSEFLDLFGYGVAIVGDTILIGAAENDTAGNDAGTAYVFVRNGTTWIEQQKLTASDAVAGALFGISVTLDGTTAVIGCLGPSPFQGSAYVFALEGSAWAEQVKLVASDGEPFDNFGLAAAISADTAVIGARSDSNGSANLAGSAYVFRLFPGPMVYCTAGTSAGGCQALLSAEGMPSASSASGFSLDAGGVEGQQDGIFFFGTNGQQASSWGNGTSYQCVVPPVVRTQLLNGTGTNGLCDGTLSLDMNAVWTNQPNKNPGAGATVQAQLWYRDPLSTSNQTTSLSDAIEFVVGP